jgi:hypothetical protein
MVDETRTAALAVLGLPRHASHLDVVRAYRRLAKLTHPDLAGPTSQDAGERFAVITDAYHALTTAPPTPPAPTPAAPTPPAPTPAATRAARPVSTQPRTTQVSWSVQPPIVAGPVTIAPIPDASVRRR